MTRAMLTCCPASTSTPPRGSAMLPGSVARPDRAFLTAIPVGPMTLANDMFVVSVWHHLGHHVPADVATPPCKCRAGVFAEADHTMLCENVAKMTQMRHDDLAKRHLASFATPDPESISRERRIYADRL